MRKNSLIAAIAVLLIVPCLHAHSIHQSTAEAEYNLTTKKLEVSLTVFINDLELALIRQCEREMRLDKTPAAEFDAQIQAYLAKTFVVKDAAGKTVKIDWLGRQIDADKKSDDPAVTLFFQIPLMDGLEEVVLRHAVFCDLFKDQTNLLLLVAGSKKSQLIFKNQDAVDSPKAQTMNQ